MKKLKKFQKGGFSVEGFKRNSPDVNNDVNYIPSGNITMRGVDFPIHGMDNLGNEKLMYPNQNYKFPGSVVREIPLKQTGGKPNPPIYTIDPKDPRLQAYQDSVYTNNVSRSLSKKVKPTFSGVNIDGNGDIHSQFGIEQFLKQKGIQSMLGTDAIYKGIHQSSNKFIDNGDFSLQYPDFKAPTQPFKIGEPRQPIQQLSIGQPNQLPTSIEQQQFQQTSMEPVRMTGHTYNSNYLGDVTIDGVKQYGDGGQMMQQGGNIYPPIHLPDAIQNVVSRSQTAPMQSMDNYPHIKRMGEIEDSLNHEVENHIDNKKYYNDSTVQLHNGNFRGANVDINLINDIVSSAKKKGVDPWTMLGVAGQETALGTHGYYSNDQNQAMSAWDVPKQYEPEDNKLWLADHRVPGVSVTKTARGLSGNWSNPISTPRVSSWRDLAKGSLNEGVPSSSLDSAENYLTQHPQLVDSYRNSQGAKIPQGKVPLMDLTADYIKQKGVQGYNPGDPDYTNKVNKRIQELKTDPAMKKYVSGKKTMQQGGPTQDMRDNYENAMGWMQSNNYDVNNPALRHNPNIGKGYFDQYNTANPGKQFNSADIPTMQKYFQDNKNSGQVRSTDPYNRGFSPVDNYPADQTLNSRQMTYQTQNGNNIRNFGTNQGAATAEVNSWKQLPPQWQANNQGIPMASNTGYQPIPRGAQQPQQNNWHTGENTDYSIDSVRTAQMGGNYLGMMEQEPTREQMQQGGMITTGVTPIDNRRQPFGKKGYFWDGEKFKKSTGSTVNGTAFSQYGGVIDDDQTPDEMKHGGIHIDPSKGKFNATKKATGKTTEELTHSSNPVTRKRAVFAQNFAHEFGGKMQQGGFHNEIPTRQYVPELPPIDPTFLQQINQPDTHIGDYKKTQQEAQQLPWRDKIRQGLNYPVQKLSGYGPTGDIAANAVGMVTSPTQMATDISDPSLSNNARLAALGMMAFPEEELGEYAFTNRELGHLARNQVQENALKNLDGISYAVMNKEKSAFLPYGRYQGQNSYKLAQEAVLNGNKPVNPNILNDISKTSVQNALNSGQGRQYIKPKKIGNAAISGDRFPFKKAFDSNEEFPASYWMNQNKYGGLQKFMQGGGGMDIPGASNVGVVNNNSTETMNDAYAPVQNAYNNAIYNSPNNQRDNISPDSAGGGNNGYTQQRRQQYPWGDTLGEIAGIGLGYGQVIKGINQQKDQHNWQQSHGQTDSAFGAQRLDTGYQKGDYSPNTGNFRPNEQTYSAPGYFPGQMQMGGQMGAHEADLDEATIQNLKRQGYKIEYL